MAKLTDKQVNDYIASQKGFKSQAQKDDLKKKSETVWFRQYVRKSKERLVKITAKLKKQIKEGKGAYFSEGRNPEEDKRGQFEMPKKRLTKKEVKTKKQGKPKKVKLSRKEKEKVKQITRRAPSGRIYSSTELHEGINSKRAAQWRAKNGIDKGDFKR